YKATSTNDYNITGSVTVDGSSNSISLPFTLHTYSVTFTEKGLPSGTKWNVTFNGVILPSATNITTFTVPNGTYSYSIGNVSGYTVSLQSNKVIVNGNNITISITFTTSSKPSSSGISGIELYAIIGVVIAAAAIVAGIAVMRIKRS
ncbi:MAG: hypothetical protein ACYDAO_10520, partial [Thermoplasmataceae archaeon]